MGTECAAETVDTAIRAHHECWLTPAHTSPHECPCGYTWLRCGDLSHEFPFAFPHTWSNA